MQGTAVKIVGRQWFWSYELCEDGKMYDSYMSDFIDGVDKPLRLEVGGVYRLLVTSADVIHSFSIPSLYLKVDAIPGRLKELYFIASRVGLFTGYCTELCGAGHAHMPVVLEVVRRS